MIERRNIETMMASQKKEFEYQGRDQRRAMELQDMKNFNQSLTCLKKQESQYLRKEYIGTRMDQTSFRPPEVEA